MSVYQVNKICRDILHDLNFRSTTKNDPVKSLSFFSLTSEERKFLLSGDVASLYKLGANPFLLQNLARFNIFGLNYENYNKRMRSIENWGIL